ncbi:putative pyridoxal phosphate-dependent aminotransferase EpsN [bioreactor metagenome]|uniref:Putative pyridoxal phosphate-dependent aminotransferase EpsN n=1 Tax=bioreactor metagenome TaxID=1076179 RepID=A0A644YUW8_9ZZZZ
MSNIVAGIGRGQLKVLDQRIEKKKYIYEHYKKELHGKAGIQMMPVHDWNKPNYWLSCISLHEELKPLDIMKALDAENIESRPIWKPMHMQPFFKGYNFIGEGICEKIFENGICLPSDTRMDDNDLEKIVAIIKSIF